MKILAAFALVSGLLLAPAAVHATPVPCFDWDCVDSTCDFDAACTTEQSSIWKYSWDFGDGNGIPPGGTTAPTHEYDPICYPEVTLEIWTWSAEKITVSCWIHTDYPSCPGPPSASTSGRCQ